ncbi:MAG: carboxypeptidase M32 [Planctomycetota bacterium]
MKTHLTRLEEIGREIKTLEKMSSLLNWDMQTYMPFKGSTARGEQQALLQSLIHEKVRSSDLRKVLKPLRRAARAGELGILKRAWVREMDRRFRRAENIPLALVQEAARLETKSFAKWAAAREKNDFALFAPYLARQVDLNRKMAERIGYANSPYNALLDYFEPGATSEWIGGVFETLKERLVPMVKRIKSIRRPPSISMLTRSFPEEKQWAFTLKILERMGYDFDAGRQDKALHPFTAPCGGIGDVRITTRLNPRDLRPGLFSSMHEGGHALYEQGFGSRIKGTPLAAGVSCAIHESQSLLWEKLIGRSDAFWKYWFPRLKRSFPEALDGVARRDFYRAVNKVVPSFIRVDADEVTYSLHIILRFELERDLIEGRIKIRDLPDLWNEKMRVYLEIEPPDHRRGVLQDVHWAGGYFGYFPSYALGILYAAQFYQAAQKAIPDMETHLAQGDLETLLGWLRKQVHCNGKLYTAEELIKRITRKPLNPECFLHYLADKYEALYSL